ncbi:MAG: glycosyltransferase [Chloroflexota bacterium]|nr:glycosyltransferase [Chloroflexota bacterium]
MESPPLSVVVPTIRGWPFAKLVLDPLREQAPRTGTEVILLDASGQPPPSKDEVGFPVRWLERPGASVFEMRREGYGLAQGQIIATTEDHCTVAPDWCERLIASHAAHPAAVAVGGAVENGTPGRTLWWAAFFRTQGPFMPPIPTGPTDRLVGAANLSYKRRMVERLGPEDGIHIDNLDMPALEPGEVLYADGGLRVAHHQPTSLWRTSVLDFHNGRATAGKRRERMGRQEWIRLGSMGVLPLYRTLRTYRTIRAKDRPAGTLERAMPALAWLHLCQATGELVGYASGPGNSPSELY